jgi:hypothetical protein
MGITWDDDGFTDAIMIISADSDDHSEGVEDMQENLLMQQELQQVVVGFIP